MVAHQNASPTSDTDSDQGTAWGKLTEPINSALNIVYKLAISFGAIATFSYLFLIGFFPSGLTPGEVIFFVFIALAFLFTYVLVIVYGTYSAVWLLQLPIFVMRRLAYTRQQMTSLLFMPADAVLPPMSAWAQWRRRRRIAVTRMWLNKPCLRWSALDGWFHALASLVLFWWLALIAWRSSSTPLMMFLSSCALSGFLILVILEAPSSAFTTKRQKNARFPAIAFIPLVVVSIYGGGPRPLLDFAFQGLGIQIMDVSLELPDSEAGAIERVADIVGRPLVDCRRPQPNRLLVHGAEVLWTGVGEHSLVRFASHKEIRRAPFDPQPTVGHATLKFDTKSMNIIRSSPPLDPCFDLPSDLLFDTGTHELDSDAKKRIDALAKSISSFGQPEKIVVRGHSDPRRIASGPDGKPIDNQILSERRAAANKQQLDAQFNTVRNEDKKGKTPKDDAVGAPVIVRSEGYGSREPKVQCVKAKDISAYELDRCNKPNRRVEVRVTYRRDKRIVSSSED